MQVELLDGSVVQIRRLSAANADAVVQLYQHLSNEECYLRFFAMHPAHLCQRARSITEQSDNQYAVGAFESEKLLGVANDVVAAVPGEAEVAFVVADSEPLRGVGTALLSRLGEIARSNGIHRLVAEVLAQNHLMLRVLCDSEWPCTRRLDGTEVHVDVDLDATKPPHATTRVS